MKNNNMSRPNTVAEKNRKSWNDGAASYCAFNQSEKNMNRIISSPQSAFHPTVWKELKKRLPDFHGKRICVPSSGDNHAVFAFAMLGAAVTSCDISENQLANAQNAAKKYCPNTFIEFIRADTMKLQGIKDREYDFVYTSNGVHVWIDDLPEMYKNIHRIMKRGGLYMMYDIHPLMRPFDDKARVVKPYTMTGPFETADEITFHWRVMDIMNAILGSGLTISHVAEMCAQIDTDSPFWIPEKELEKGVKLTADEVNRMYDPSCNPLAALPQWLSLTAEKMM